MHSHSHLALENQAPPADSVFIRDGDLSFPSSSSMAVDVQKSAKKGTRQWAAWTRQEEESFFNALRQVGKNFEKITSRVQSKNKDQVRHYYYRLVRRINKLLGPGFCLDAKNSKDTNAAMLRWWALLEKHSCTASKLHLKPRRFKLFIETLEHQLLKDRNKTRRKHLSQEESCLCTPSTTILSKASGNDAHHVKVLEADTHNAHKIGGNKGASLKRNSSVNSHFNRGDLNSMKCAKQKRRAGVVASAAYKRWEKAAMAGVSLVADAAEQLERAASGQKKIITIGNNIFSLPSPALGGTCSHWCGETAVQPFTKLKLQLFPIDEDTRKALEKDAHNPYLELTLSAKKRISSVLDHLNRKWGNSRTALGELMLFPYGVQQDDIANLQRWTIKDSVASAADVYASIGSPPIFRLRYGWFSNVELGSGIIHVSSEAPCLENCIESNNTQEACMDMDVHKDKNIGEDATQLPKQSAASSEDQSDSTMAPTPSLHEVMVEGNLTKSNDDCKQQEDMAILRVKNDTTVLAGEWADSLTAISVGDLLSEASKACDSDPVDPSLQGSALCTHQIQFSYDSFDAAVAAHISGYQLPSISNQVPHSAIWNGEETCDEFSFRFPPAPKGKHPNPSSSTSVSVSSQIACSSSLSFYSHLKAFSESGQSDGPSCEDLKVASEPAKDMILEMGKLDSAKDPCLMDFYWPDSLGPLDLDTPSCRYEGQDLVLGDSVSLSGLSNLLANSLGALCSRPSLGIDRTDPLASEARGAPIFLDGKIGSDD